MQMTLGIMVSSVTLATIYGVAFAMSFPLVQIDTSIVSLCSVLGLATSFGCLGISRMIRRKRRDTAR
jgi:hypothetical protein